MTDKQHKILSAVVAHQPISMIGLHSLFPHWSYIEVEVVVDRLFDCGWLRYNQAGNIIADKALYEQQTLFP